KGGCGCCWAFVTTGIIEGQLAIGGKGLVSLSEQNLVDCVSLNRGCRTGSPHLGLNYVFTNGGIETSDAYPYTACQGQTDTCRYNASNSAARIPLSPGYIDVAAGDEAALKEAVATIGPIGAAIDVMHNSFANYASGVLYEPKCQNENPNHGILVIGYGTDPEHGDYWLIKNSWGTTWGEEGYGKIARNRDNHCGIASMAMYALL
ncbi:hypothetical protein PENTCL1PPCAC_20666, partial [Pristionchus entomophagus]